MRVPGAVWRLEGALPLAHAQPLALTLQLSNASPRPCSALLQASRGKGRGFESPVAPPEASRRLGVQGCRSRAEAGRPCRWGAGTTASST